jgi:hypothetical protein
MVVTISFCAVRLGVLSAQSQSSLPTSRPVYRPYKGTHVSIYIKSLWVFGVGTVTIYGIEFSKNRHTNCEVPPLFGCVSIWEIKLFSSC